MTVRVLRYSVGNEHDPGDPWGRSELVIDQDGTARLEYHLSRVQAVGAWTGRVETAALEALWAGLERAGFPSAPATPLTPGASARKLVVETDGEIEQAYIGYHRASALSGYAEAFDILDAIIRQLSADAITYPTNQPAIVRDATETRDGPDGGPAR